MVISDTLQALPILRRSIFCWPDSIATWKMVLTGNFCAGFYFYAKESSCKSSIDEDLILPVNSRALDIKSLTVFCNLLSCSDFPFATPVLLLISTWFFFNSRGKFKFPEKQRTNLKYHFFKAGVVKYFSQSQTVANQIKLFIFDTPKYRKYFDKFWWIWP